MNIEGWCAPGDLMGCPFDTYAKFEKSSSSLEFRVQGLGFRVTGTGFRVANTGLGVGMFESPPHNCVEVGS